MTSTSDQAARVRALTDLVATLLVEAAAGTGKTSLLAGRVVALLASGVAARSIAAITFTDFAAGELRTRIGRFIRDVLNGAIPPDLQPAFPTGLSEGQRIALQENAAQLDELTCTTIHGFCHSLLRSYAIEAGIDPGADILDKGQGDFALRSVFERWLSRRLGPGANMEDPIVLMAQWDPRESVRTLNELCKFRREFRTAAPLASDLDAAADREFVEAVREFRRWLNGTPRPVRVEEDLSDLEELATFFEGAFDPLPSFRKLWKLAHPKRIDAMRWQSLELRTFARLADWRKASNRDEGDRLSAEAVRHAERCAQAFRTLIGRVATALLSQFCSGTNDFLVEYEAYKRNAAVLDFDDLLAATRQLLREHAEVRSAVSGRYTRLLVDEFQDTDPIQAEILFLIAGKGGAADKWQQCALEPGRLFMVGDPKQAIYRFRGADVAAYIEARTTIEQQFPGNILRVTSNFRSRAAILDHVNLCFRERLGAQAAGYVPLQSTLGSPEHGLPCVTKLTIDIDTSAKIGAKRDAEAKRVAEVCSQLVGNVRVRRSDGSVSPLAPGDIALLTPGRTDVWRYEQALEEKGLPFVSQAGRNLFRRQETQDLIAIMRVLANRRDSLALGALLRGPIVGLTEQELLDIAEALALAGNSGLLSLETPPELVTHPLAREVLDILRDLRRRSRGTTPYAILGEALERLNVRPKIAARSTEQAARALSNIDLLMERARGYAVRGLVRFASDLTEDWEKAEGYEEARIDGGGQAIDIVTMHSSKGLEWPVVIPINMGTQFRRRDTFIFRRQDNSLHWVLGDVVPPAMVDAVGQDDRETAEERERLLYVTCTRSIDMLIMPQLPDAASNTWGRLLDLKLDAVPELDVSHLLSRPVGQATAASNLQTPEVFAAEWSQIESVSKPIRWLRPSDTDADRQLLEASEQVDFEQFEIGKAELSGSIVRGVVLHKLMEELLTGELGERVSTVERRAATLIEQLGQEAASLQPAELAATALRTLALPPVAERRGRLLPELNVYASQQDGAVLVSGRADAISYADGKPEIVFDWKSDVAPTDNDRATYGRQVRSYATSIGAARGAVVYMTLGQIQWVEL